MLHRMSATVLIAAAVAWAPSLAPTAPLGADTPPPSRYLFLWSSSVDSTAPDFLALLDVQEHAGRYGRLVATVPVPGRKNRTHHTEYEMPAGGHLFANGFGSGQSFVFDLTKPEVPRIDAQFGDAGALMHPHSFVRLPGGNVLATFQMQHDSLGTAPGGLAEFTPAGQLVRSASADLPGVDRHIRPYSALVLPRLDRVVVTTTDMDKEVSTRIVQVWRLSDLSLLHAIELPAGPLGHEGYFSAEPRLLSDGKTVIVSTFNCGMYRLDGLDSAAPSAQFIASFPRKPGTSCAVPVVAGRFYLVTVPAWSAVVSMDMTDPAHPREASRITLGADDVPHWLAVEPNLQRIVITGYKAMKSRVLLARFNSATGALALDERFRQEGSAEPGFRMEGVVWPHGGSAAAVPHGAVFSRE